MKYRGVGIVGQLQVVGNGYREDVDSKTTYNCLLRELQKLEQYKIYTPRLVI